MPLAVGKIKTCESCLRGALRKVTKPHGRLAVKPSSWHKSDAHKSAMIVGMGMPSIKQAERIVQQECSQGLVCTTCRGDC
jgi:hypothetical protein